MALTYTFEDKEFDPESVDTVITNTFAHQSSTVADGAGNWADGAITLDINNFSYDQDFIATDTAHPDAVAADLTVKAVWYNNGAAATTLTITSGSGDGLSLGSLDTTGYLEFQVTGIEEGCELTINYDLDNNSNLAASQIDKISVAPVKGLNDCNFQTVLKYQQFNQKINNRFDADTKEFSSFKDMLKRIKRIK
jgi:hypothetical protein